MILRIDYETYSDLELTDVGVWAYAAHPSTEILLAAWSINGGPVRIWCRGEPPPVRLRRAMRRATHIRAYNANFERALTELVGTRQLGLPIPRADQWDDTAALCAMTALPRHLEGAARVLRVDMQKDKTGKKLINLFCKPRRPTAANPSRRVLPEDAPEEWEAFKAYCKQDVRAEAAVHAALPIQDLPPFERKLWAIDSEINRRGFAVNRRLARGASKIAAAAQKILGDEFRATVGINPTQVQKFKAWLAAKGVTIASFDKRVLPDVLAKLGDKVPPLCRRMIDIRTETNKSSLAKYHAMLRMCSPDGRVRGLLRYHGAERTGRWAGNGLQPHNLAKPKLNNQSLCPLVEHGDYSILALFDSDVLGILRDVLRHAIVAALGNTLSVSDLAQIEARMIGWLANAQTFLDCFRRGEDIYRYTASIIFNKKIEDITDWERSIGKQAVLGLGYGMGWAKFQSTCAQYQIVISEELAKRTVATFRETYHEIPAYWRRLERAAIACVTSRRPVKVGCVEYRMERHWLTCRLPSGRALWYPHAKVQRIMKFDQMRDALTFVAYKKDGTWTASTWGGTLAENIDQAMSRDIVAHAVVRCEEARLPVVIHVHDEIGVEVPEAQGADALRTMDRILQTPPAWAQGLPLESKGYVSPVYRKD